MTLFWFLVIGFFLKKCFLFIPNGNQLGFHMKYHLLDFIQTNMHTTVRAILEEFSSHLLGPK